MLTEAVIPEEPSMLALQVICVAVIQLRRDPLGADLDGGGAAGISNRLPFFPQELARLVHENHLDNYGAEIVITY